MLDRWVIERIDHSITVSVRSDGGRLVACRWLRFDRIRNTIVVTIKIEVVLDTVSISINRRRAKQLIPDSISIIIREVSRQRFCDRNMAIHVHVGVNCILVAAFH